MNQSNLVFTNIGQVDSTNNYAIAQINEGLAKDGMAWFSSHQTAGKGQRGKIWEANPGESIALTMIFEPPSIFLQRPFLFNVLISLSVRSFLDNIINKANKEQNASTFSEEAKDILEKVYIKWPNDLYINDRKAGGILIENKYRGSLWNWTVVGIGINVNQTHFSDELKRAVSLKQITHQTYPPEDLARALHQVIANAVYQADESNIRNLLSDYNQFLYKKGMVVKFKKDNVLFESTVIGADEFGCLLTQDVTERSFQFGEIEWQLS